MSIPHFPANKPTVQLPLVNRCFSKLLAKRPRHPELLAKNTGICECCSGAAFSPVSSILWATNLCVFFIHIILAKNSTTVIGNFVATRLYKLSIKRIQSLVSFLISATRRPLPVGKSAKQGRRMLDYWPNVCCSSNRKLQMCKQHTANYKATPLCSGGLFLFMAVLNDFWTFQFRRCLN